MDDDLGVDLVELENCFGAVNERDDMGFCGWSRWNKKGRK